MTRIITNKLIMQRARTTVEQIRSKENTKQMNYRADRYTYGAAAVAAVVVLLSPMSSSMKRLPMSGKKSSLGK